MKGESTLEIYNQIDPEQYETRHERISREGYLRNHWGPLIAIKISKYCKNKMVLDLGCGGGTYTELISKYTNRVLGIDISQVMLNYAKNKHPILNLILADAHHIPLKTCSIDTVVCIGIFEYVKQAPVLKEIDRVLKQGGICIMQIPNKYSAARILSKLFCKIFGKEYFAKEPSYGEMLRLLRQNGFKVVKFKMDDGLVYLPDLLDELVGKQIYLLIEKFFRPLGRNPFSNEMLFVVRKK